MTTILVKDTLRKSVEAASGGKQTIIYTKKGQPSFMNILEKFDISTIDTTLSGTHPAFIVDGVEKDVIYVGTYKGSISKGELVSQPYQAPMKDYYQNLISYARAAGKGFHVYTMAERAAINALSKKASATVLGAVLPNGSSQIDETQKALLDSSGKLKNGSGPISFRHDNSFTGVSDLIGGGSELISGFRMFNFELQMLENNNAASDLFDLSYDSNDWRCIDGASSSFVPHTQGSVTSGSVRFFNERMEPYSFSFNDDSGLYITVSSAIKKYGTNAVVSDDVINYLRKIGFIPHAGFKSVGEKYTVYPTRIASFPIVEWSPGSNGSDAGLHSLRFDQFDTLTQFFARPCFVNL